MPSVVTEELAALARAVGPEPDETLAAMERRADREGFPIVGPEVGGWLALLTQVINARRVFEFGSGFGYSAYWFARELPPDGEVVLTEIDRDELDAAREYFREAGLAGRARFEAGDALDTVGTCDGPFDLLLIDNEKERYIEAFEAGREKLRDGGLVVTDNAITAGSIDRADVLGLVRGEDRPGATAASRGIADYLVHVDKVGFETALLPLGEGVAVSVKR